MNNEFNIKSKEFNIKYILKCGIFDKTKHRRTYIEKINKIFTPELCSKHIKYGNKFDLVTSKGDSVKFSLEHKTLTEDNFLEIRDSCIDIVEIFDNNLHC